MNLLTKEYGKIQTIFPIDHRRFVHSQSSSVVADGAASPPEHGAKPIPSGGARPRYSNTTGNDDVAFNRKLKHMGKCMSYRNSYFENFLGRLEDI